MIPVDFQLFQQQVPIPDFVRGTKSKLWYCGFCGDSCIPRSIAKHLVKPQQLGKRGSCGEVTVEALREVMCFCAAEDAELAEQKIQEIGGPWLFWRQFLRSPFELFLVGICWGVIQFEKKCQTWWTFRMCFGEMKSRRRKTMGIQPEYSHLATRSAAYQRAFEDWPWAKTERIAASNIHPLEDLSKLGMFTQSHGRYFDPHKEFRYLDIFGDFTIYINYTRTDRIDGWHQYINSYISNYIYI